MKYLKLLEAFKSRGISKMMEFLKNKNINFLKVQLGNMMSLFDIPLNEIEDVDIEYLSAKKAVHVQVPNDWVAPPGSIYAIKFWFSLDEFLGITGIGNTTNMYDLTFTEKEREYIENELNIKTGILEKVQNYESLKTGDVVVCLIYDLSATLVKGTIVRDDSGSIFIIQNKCSGNKPDCEFSQYGRFSWCIYSNRVSSDHGKLYLYTDTNDEIKVKIIDSLEVFSFNLPINRNKLCNWKEHETYIIKDSVFCFIIYIDNIIKRSDIKKYSLVKTDRIALKNDATYLQTNSVIKDNNIRRYLAKKFELLGIGDGNYKNLENVLLLSICYKYPFYVLNSDNDCSVYLDNFISRVIRKQDGRSIFLNNYIYFNQYVNVVKTDIERFVKSLVKDTDDKIELFDIIEEINTEITNFIKQSQINTIDGMIKIKDILDDIKQLKYSDNMRDIFYFSINSHEKYVFPNDIKPDIERLREIKKEIKHKLLK